MNQKIKQNSVSSHAGHGHDSTGAMLGISAAAAILVTILTLALLSMTGSGSARSSVAVAFTAPVAGAALVTAPTLAGFPVGATPSPTLTTQPQPSLTLTPTSTCTPAWSVVTSPNYSGENNYLDAIGAASPDDMWAVGSHQGHAPLIQHWDGSQWSIQPQGLSCCFLGDVSVIAANDIWAVGSLPGGHGGTFTIHWDGANWRVIPSPQFDLGSRLDGVAAVSATDVWAVGYYNVPGIYARTLIIHWDGSQWSVVPSPNIGDNSNYLFDVDAISANDMWVVGFCFNCKGLNEGTLTMHWDGVSWQLMDSPDVARNNHLYGVAAIATNDVWAVGGSQAGGLTMHWNGSEWIIVPNPSMPLFSLGAVAARSTDDVWAVGQGGASHIVTLTMHWDGSAWSIVPSPSPGGGGNYLDDVVALAENDVWAVGRQINANFETLIMRYSDACPVPSPSPTLSSSPTPTITLTSTPGISSTSTRTFTPTLTPTLTPTPVASATVTASTDTPTRSATAIVTGTATIPATATRTATITPTLTSCSITFSDVHPTDYFYEAVQYLHCHDVISGYSDNTFRPYNDTTRGQLTKIVVLGFGLEIYTPPQPTFSDVPATHPFYQFVETAVHENIVSGYSDGTFRPGNNVTRGQLSKIVVSAAGWMLLDPPSPTFSDVPRENPFFAYVETAFEHGIISGYADGTFRPGNNATRGQISKIIHSAIIAP